VIETLANWGEFIGGVAVVALLVYLGLQVKAATEQARLDRTHLTTELWTRYTVPVGSSPETSELLYRGIRDLSALSPEENFRFNLLMAMYFGPYENNITQYKGGQISEENFQRHMNQAYGMFLQPGVQTWWSTHGERIQSPEIVHYLEDRKRNSDSLHEATSS